MSKKIPDTFQPKITRNDRFAQMSQQEKIIEQKKKEILEKLEAKQKANAENAKNAKIAKDNKSTTKKEDTKAEINVFSNDGSFLDQFKQMKDKRLDSKLKSFRQREHSDDHNKNRYKPKKRSPSPKERPKPRISRFDKTPSYEPKITFNTSFSSTITQPQYEIQPPIAILPQNVTGQPLLKNIVGQPNVAYPTVSNESIITAPPVLINVPPPQIVQGPLVMPPNQQQAVLVQNPMVSLPPNTILNTLPPPSTILNTPPPPNMAVSAPPVLPVPPPATMSVLSTVELTSIPPPSPIQVQSIPQPEPMNTMNIPHPAPMQVQNIPTPEPVQLNDIPNPRPMDVLSIPTPGEDNVMSDFIKSIPPPNKSIPPPSLQDVHQTSLNLLPSNILPLVSTVQNLPTQSMLVNVPPPHPIQNTFTSISVPLPVTVTTVVNSIPSLMAQPILPPPGINVNVSCPPPMMTMLQQPPPPMFVTQPPPLTNQMPPMNVPPPNANLMSGFMPGLRDMNAGTPDYEQMASLGRMVAECGTGIEDVVRQRKTQDPSLWFLFHKESAAYSQYLQLIEKFKREKAAQPVDTSEPYDPEKSYDDNVAGENDYMENQGNKRKRKSRWGDKDPNINPPPIITIPVQPPALQSGSKVMLSKISRTDPALVQYAVNTFGSANLTEEDWKKAEDHYKINLLYQDMVKKREELERLEAQGRKKYDYDSDEEIDGGTWEHRLREKEMMATQLWVQELNRQAEGKHHIGDFLPPDEFKRFMEKSSAAKEGRQLNLSDYKDFKIKEDNIGFKMLQKLGWTEGTGLGQSGTGIVDPVNKAAMRDQNQGLGLIESDEDNGDEYESYRKRMMLAYRFRPNPLNNPRRPYY